VNTGKRNVLLGVLAVLVMIAGVFINPPFLVYVPLLIAFVAIGWHAWPLMSSPFKRGLSDWTEGEKVEARASGKGFVYLLVAWLLLIKMPPIRSWAGLVFMTALVALFALIDVLAVVNLDHPRLNWLDQQLWRDGPKTPGYSRSGRQVPHVRWMRRIVFVTLAVVLLAFVSINALIGGGGHDELRVVQPQTEDITHSPAVTPSPSTAPSTSAPSLDASPSASATATADNCGAPALKKQDPPAKSRFDAGSVDVCKDGKWVAWSSSKLDTPSMVYVTGWTEQEGYGFGTITLTENGQPVYTIRATVFGD
jgi:hypothetical protein